MDNNYNSKLTIERIKELIKKHDYSQKDLAVMVGIDCGSLSKILSGSKAIGTPVLANLATALKTTTDYLLGLNGNSGRDEGFNSRKEILILARNKEQLKEEEKKEIIKLLLDI